jgi:hypothetical protein
MYVMNLRVARIHGAKGGKLMVLVPWQSLGEKIRDVVAARDMLDAELVALDTVLQPMKPHVYAFRQARRDRPIGQAHGDLVIAKEEGGGLGVAQVVQDGALDVGETSGSEEGGILSLLYGGTDYGDSVRVAGERPIDESKGVGRETCPRDAREVMK